MHEITDGGREPAILTYPHCDFYCEDHGQLELHLALSHDGERPTLTPNERDFSRGQVRLNLRRGWL